MTVVRYDETPKEPIAEKRERYLSHTNDLMMVVLDFTDGPMEEPDPPHHHVHEQISYIAEGEVIFFLDGEPHPMKAGDMVAIPSNVPHCLQLLTEKVRLIDTFNPIREEFLK